MIEGVVIRGNRLGSRMGVPTANIEVGDELDIPDGVYASQVTLDGRTYGAMSDLGRKPTVGGRRRLLETTGSSCSRGDRYRRICFREDVRKE